ncbi:LysE family transporter, partial [cf. Phormidesmis sp. LEGE 11477]|uniref:LysE family transporter n=1 Tax=cf. Phormidesmis sp. LEGE 11477 TaxID=1828680 RepID=UPI001881BCCE
ADGLYGMVAAFGLTAVSDFLVGYSSWLRIGGGLFLCYLGLTTFLNGGNMKSLLASPSNPLSNPLSNPGKPSLPISHSSPTASRVSGAALFSAYTSTLALTLANPATILSFVAIFAGLGITQSAYLDSVTLVFGVFSGSILWWLVLVSGVAYLRDRLTPARLFRFNQFSRKVFGGLIIGFGVVALASAI